MSTYRLKGASGAVANQTFALSGRTLIGSAADCDLRVEQQGVAARHAEIVEEAGGLQLQSLHGGAALRVNGEPVQRCRLASGDEIRIANCCWVLQAPGLRPEKVLTEAALKPRWRLLPWLIVGALLGAAAIAWQQGLLPF